jgi:hypothetical protein
MWILKKDIAMTQKDLVKELRELKAQHKGRLGMLEHIVAGSVSDCDVACMPELECSLTKWLAERKDILHSIYGPQAINEFSFWHKEWHNESEALCRLFSSQNTLLGKMFGRNRFKLKDDDLDIANAHLERLLELTNKIDNSFEQMLARIVNLSDRAFQRTFNVN